MTVKVQLNKSRSFLQFFISNFLEMSLYVIYFDDLAKNWGVECKNRCVQKKHVFLQSRYLSRFWIFWSEIFSKCLISYHSLIIWWKIHVLLTKNLPPQIWLSPKNLEKFSHRRCYLHDSQSSTEQISESLKWLRKSPE